MEGLIYRFVTLTPYKFFGYETILLLGEDVQMAEREKAIADGFDHPEPSWCCWPRPRPTPRWRGC